MISRAAWSPSLLVVPALLAAASVISCIGSEPLLPDGCGEGRIICSLSAGEAGVQDICVDARTDANHCGACGVVCPPGEYCTGGTCAPPTSCADLKAKAGPAEDGSYLIQPANKKPFTVHCSGMSTPTPREYLTLLHTRDNGAQGSNVSAYDRVTCKCGDDMRRYFEKVRLDPQTLVVDRSDGAFAANVSSDPQCWAAAVSVCTAANDLPFGMAGNCILNGVPMPGNIDLRGTTFSIDPSVTFVPTGADAYGSSMYSADRKKVDFTGGGYCGAIDPNPWLLLRQD